MERSLAKWQSTYVLLAELNFLLAQTPFSDEVDVMNYRERLRSQYGELGDTKDGDLQEMVVSQLSLFIPSCTMAG